MKVAEMEAGRELDCVMDERAMGLTGPADTHRMICAGRKSDKPGFCEGPIHEGLGVKYNRCAVPSYSTLLEEAWKLVRMVLKDGGCISTIRSFLTEHRTRGL